MCLINKTTLLKTRVCFSFEILTFKHLAQDICVLLEYTLLFTAVCVDNCTKGTNYKSLYNLLTQMTFVLADVSKIKIGVCTVCIYECY